MAILLAPFNKTMRLIEMPARSLAMIKGCTWQEIVSCLTIIMCENRLVANSKERRFGCSGCVVICLARRGLYTGE